MKNAHQTSLDKGSWKDDLNSQHPPSPAPETYTQSLHTRSHFHTHYIQTYTQSWQKNKKNNSNMDSLINTTCFHKVTESANNWKLPCHLTENWEG